MFIKKENVDEVLELTHANCEEYNIDNRFDAMLMLSYKNLLDEIAKKSKYKEGTTILESDLEKIKTNVNDIITDLAKEIEKREQELIDFDRMHFSGFDTLMAANDYLYALAMQKLGCPDMPTSFGADVCTNIQKHAKKLDEKVKKSYYNKDYSTKTYFDNQRKKDADVVRFKNKSLISDINSKLGTPDQIAELVAEYQALKLRQDGHGRIWRFFHRTENNERMELLADMKAAITNAVGEDVNLDPKEKTPADIAKLLNDKLIDKKATEALNHDEFAKRCKCADKISYEKLPKENSIAKQENNKQNVNIVENEKRVVVEFKNGEFNEHDVANVEPAVSNDSVSKNNPQLEK